jgi:hypothetical protein
MINISENIKFSSLILMIVIGFFCFISNAQAESVLLEMIVHEKVVSGYVVFRKSGAKEGKIIEQANSSWQITADIPEEDKEIGSTNFAVFVGESGKIYSTAVNEIEQYHTKQLLSPTVGSVRCLQESDIFSEELNRQLKTGDLKILLEEKNKKLSQTLMQLKAVMTKEVIEKLSGIEKKFGLPSSEPLSPTMPIAELTRRISRLESLQDYQ